MRLSGPASSALFLCFFTLTTTTHVSAAIANHEIRDFSSSSSSSFSPATGVLRRQSGCTCVNDAFMSDVCGPCSFTVSGSCTCAVGKSAGCNAAIATCNKSECSFQVNINCLDEGATTPTATTTFHRSSYSASDLSTSTPKSSSTGSKTSSTTKQSASGTGAAGASSTAKSGAESVRRGGFFLGGVVVAAAAVGLGVGGVV